MGCFGDGTRALFHKQQQTEPFIIIIIISYFCSPPSLPRTGAYFIRLRGIGVLILGGGNVCTHTCICCGGRSTPPPPDEIHIETVYNKKQTKYAYIISFHCFYIFKEHGRVINIFILGRNTTSIRHV